MTASRVWCPDGGSFDSGLLRLAILARGWIAPEFAEVPGLPLVRERIHRADVQPPTQDPVGYASSLAAQDGARDLGRALTQAVPTIRTCLAHKGASFIEIVAAKRKRQLKTAP